MRTCKAVPSLNNVAEFSATGFHLSDHGVEEESIDAFAQKIVKASPWQTVRRHLNASRRDRGSADQARFQRQETYDSTTPKHRRDSTRSSVWIVQEWVTG